MKRDEKRQADAKIDDLLENFWIKADLNVAACCDKCDIYTTTTKVWKRKLGNWTTTWKSVPYLCILLKKVRDRERKYIQKHATSTFWSFVIYTEYVSHSNHPALQIK